MTAPRRASGQHSIGLVPCPKCKGSGLDMHSGEPLERLTCDLCNGGRVVAVDVGIKWSLEHADTEPPPKE